MSGLTSDEKTIYDECLTDWYTRASQSKDMQIRNSSLFMLTSRALRKEDYEKAQELLDQLPERTAINKLTLQIELLLGKGQTIYAVCPFRLCGGRSGGIIAAKRLLYLI